MILPRFGYHMTDFDQMNPPQKAGTVIHIDGHAHALRLADGKVRLSLGRAIYSGDVIETDTDGQLTILFSDGSELMLGPNSRFSLDSFVFNRALRHSRLDAWVLDGAFVFACGMTSDGGAAVFQTRKARIHVTNGKICGKTDPVEKISMFTLLSQSGGYIGSASLICDDSAVMLGGANDTSVVSDDTAQASKVTKLSDEDLAESYAGLFVGAWQSAALDIMSPAKRKKQTAAEPTTRAAADMDSKKSA